MDSHGFLEIHVWIGYAMDSRTAEGVPGVELRENLISRPLLEVISVNFKTEKAGKMAGRGLTRISEGLEKFGSQFSILLNML